MKLTRRGCGDVLLLLLLFAAYRFTSLLLLRPGGFLADFSDYYYYREYAALADRGLYPYVNIWSPYPPIFPWLLVGIHRLTMLLPPWEEPQLFFNLALGSVLTLADGGNLLLVYALAGGANEHRRALRSAIFYALLFVPAYTAQAHFDGLAVFFLLLGLWLLLRGRWFLAGLTTGLGAMTKLLPALLLPLAVRRALPDLLYPLHYVQGKLLHRVQDRSFPRWKGGEVPPSLPRGEPALNRSPEGSEGSAKWAGGEVEERWDEPNPPGSPFAALRAGSSLRGQGEHSPPFLGEGKGERLAHLMLFALAFAAAVLAVAAPFFYPNPRLLLAPLDIERIRPPWQTVWAVLDGYYGFGVAPADVRDLSALGRPAWRGHVPYSLLTLVFLGLYLWLYLRHRDWRRSRTAIAFLALSLALLFIFSKGWSPQYLAWLLPFLAILWPGWRGAAYALSLTFLNYLESHLYFILLPQERWLLVLTTMARTLLLALLALELAGEYWQRHWLGATWRRRLAWGLAVATVAGLPLLSWRLLDAYTRARYQSEPAKPAIEHLRQAAATRAVAYFVSQADLERFYPYLHGRLALRTLDERAPDGDLPKHLYAQFITNQTGEIWLLRGPGDTSALAASAEQVLSGLAYRVEAGVIGPYDVSCWLPFSYLTRPEEAMVFGGNVELLAWRLVPGEPLKLYLIWQLRQPLERPLSAFVHVTGDDGRPLAQSDGPPAWPWPVGSAILDKRTISTAALAAGSYRVLLGLYDPTTGERLSLPDGNDSLLLETTQVSGK